MSDNSHTGEAPPRPDLHDEKNSETDHIAPLPDNSHDAKPRPVPMRSQSMSQLDRINTNTDFQFDFRSTEALSQAEFRMLVGITSMDYAKFDKMDNGNKKVKTGDLTSTKPQFSIDLTPTPQKTWFHLFKRGDTFTNYGLYRTVCIEEEVCRWRYHSFNTLLNFSLIAQLGLSAAVIALGAQSGDYHIPVTVIGAFNGVLAGILSLVKGQGLPARILQYRNALKRVRDAIERVDRMFGIDGHRHGAPPVTYLEVEAIFHLYYDARKISESNHPDIWNSDTQEVQRMMDRTAGTIFSHKPQTWEEATFDNEASNDPKRMHNTKTAAAIGPRPANIDRIALTDPNALFSPGGSFHPGRRTRFGSMAGGRF